MLQGAEPEAWSVPTRLRSGNSRSETREPGDNIASTVRMVAAETMMAPPCNPPNQDGFRSAEYE